MVKTMGANKKILEKIILIISITVLVAGFYFCSFHNGNFNKIADPSAAVSQMGKTVIKNENQDTTKNNNSIDLVRPAFLDK